ncbi:alpha/beta hydrolase [Deinococcus sp. Arct2-2]|uniref:alpha/beta fold hydrolase n=1 Tax=Deinococcus sp. Arct2-2 TaxID=2568653 RepID=UPI001454D220|nr:alpha/beta hydrolase [Deinococcus sp. Arct2-2]
MVWLALAPVCGLIFGLLSFFAGAALISAPPGLICLGAAGVWTGTAALTWCGLKRRHDLSRPLFWSLLYATTVLLLAGVAAGLQVFRPLLSLSPQPAPAQVRYWLLPDGSQLAYFVSAAVPSAARRSASPVIFLHGGPGTPGEGTPKGTSALNASGFDVYAYDQIGAGRSSRLTDITQYTVARQVSDLEAVRRKLGAPQLILVGRSWGATLAAAYLAAYPHRVARVIFVSPAPLWQGAYPNGSEGTLADRLTPSQRQRLRGLLFTPRMLVQSVLMQINPAAAHALVGDAEADTYFRQAAVAALPAARCSGSPLGQAHANLPGYYTNQRTSSDAERIPDPRPVLRHIPVPALILRGECDFIRAVVAREYSLVLPAAHLVAVSGAGHDVAGEQPDLYTQLLLQFLEAGSAD